MSEESTPISMRLHCPKCGEMHVDQGEFATKPHHTHSCQYCGLTWRPAIPPTVGVRYLPGFRDEVRPIDWAKGVLPHEIRVTCGACKSDGGTSAPGVFGWTFYGGRWWCEKHPPDRQ
jgi:hypothetical protein